MFGFSSIANLQDFRMKSLQSQLKMLALDQFQKVQFVTMYKGTQEYPRITQEYPRITQEYPRITQEWYIF